MTMTLINMPSCCWKIRYSAFVFFFHRAHFRQRAWLYVCSVRWGLFPQADHHPSHFAIRISFFISYFFTQINTIINNLNEIVELPPG